MQVTWILWHPCLPCRFHTGNLLYPWMLQVRWSSRKFPSACCHPSHDALICFDWRIPGLEEKVRASGGGERCDLGEQQRAQIGQPGPGGGSAAARCPGGAAGATFPQAQQLGLGDPGDLLCSVWGCQEQPPLCICVCPGEGPGISLLRLN